ncbi:MAG TPA: UvrD-helicase domain-containing protein [Anaerolineales bacterium]|nr:UvrD-helicase domain-containing protein [Anaerolineales bacterium]
MDFLTGLNEQQRKAVTSCEGPVLVLAGPGSGKTRVLTHSIAYRIRQLGARPYSLLAVTFTNKAAREMEDRVTDLLGEQVRGLTMGTFHGVCVRLLRREAEHLPFDANFVIFDADDQERVVKQALNDLDIDDKLYRPGSVHGAISRAKNELILPEDYPLITYRDEVVRRIYEKYQQLLVRSNGLDFDDLLLWTATLLEQHPAVREKYARRYEHILVDEFQDTNMAQYQLLRHLGSHHGNLFVVGDVDQSIYRWRGADYRNVRRFESDFPGVRVILLEQNYRSTQEILDAAMAVIRPNRNRTHKNLQAVRGAGHKLRFHEAYDDRAEAAFVVDNIANQVASGGADPGDFAIMYRTNAQSRLLEEAFLRAGLPYRLVGAQRFYGRREVKDVIAYLRLVYNPADEISLLRAVNVPPRRIGQKTQAALRQQAERARMSAGDLLFELSRGEDSPFFDMFQGRTAAPLAVFGGQYARWRSALRELTPLQLMDRILADIDYESYLDTSSDEGLSRWENVLELRRLAAEYDERGLAAFLEDVALISDQDTLDDTGSVPTLLTLHAAKGLEFPVVFIVGLEDGTLPHARSFDDPEGMEEERRLLYVGVTRARDALYLVNARNRTAFGYAEQTEPSRFLADIPEDLLKGPARVRTGLARSREAVKTLSWDEANGAGAAKVRKYAAGMKVRHEVWGDGMVLNSRLQDGDETVDIFFERVGLKRLSASLAKLDIMER